MGSNNPWKNKLVGELKLMKKSLTTTDVSDSVHALFTTSVPWDI
jgi:hypothetical protein